MSDALFCGCFFFVFLLTDEGRGAILLWLTAVLISLNVGRTQFYFLSSALTGLLMLSLFAARWFRLKDTHIEAAAPRRTIVDQPLTFTITLCNSGQQTFHNVRLRLPFLPWDGQWIMQPDALKTFEAGELVHLRAKARFVARGLHHLDPFSASQLVPLGLANGPSVTSKGVRFLVVPRISNVVGFHLGLRERYQPGGVALASLTGESRELVGVRPYQFGDPIRDLHAATWARSGMPHVRKYQQEYFTRVGVVVDTDRSHAGEAQFEAALSLAAGVMAYLSRGEALIDLLVLGDQVHPLVLGRNLGFLEQALDLLAVVPSGPALSAEDLEARIEPYMGRLSALVFIALTWDNARQRFGEWILSHGISRRIICVAKKNDGIWPDNGHDIHTLTVSDIQNGEALRL